MVTQIGLFSDIQRIVRQSPERKADLMAGLAKKVPQLYRELQSREDAFMASLMSEKPIGSSLGPNDYVLVNAASKQVCRSENVLPTVIALSSACSQ